MLNLPEYICLKYFEVHCYDMVDDLCIQILKRLVSNFSCIVVMIFFLPVKFNFDSIATVGINFQGVEPLTVILSRF